MLQRRKILHKISNINFVQNLSALKHFVFDRIMTKHISRCLCLSVESEALSPFYVLHC